MNEDMHNEEEMVANVAAPDGAEAPEAVAEKEVSEQPSIEEQLAAAQQEAAKNLDGWQRALADLSNARKRFDKQTQMAFTNATVDVVSKVLPIIDDFDRAMESVPPEIAENAWFDGLGGVLRKLNRILEGINAERIPALGEQFDPNVHEALSTDSSTTEESGTIVSELQAGYRIGDRVIRPALVIVAE